MSNKFVLVASSSPVKFSKIVFPVWSLKFVPQNQFLTVVANQYPASNWFLLRQMREKPLRVPVYISIEHERVRHAPRDAFDVNFICQLIFRLKCLYKRMQISHQKRWQKKKDPNLRRSIVYI